MCFHAFLSKKLFFLKLEKFLWLVLLFLFYVLVSICKIFTNLLLCQLIISPMFSILLISFCLFPYSLCCKRVYSDPLHCCFYFPNAVRQFSRGELLNILHLKKENNNNQYKTYKFLRSVSTQHASVRLQKKCPISIHMLRTGYLERDGEVRRGMVLNT